MQPGSIEIHDDLGRLVQLPAAPGKIVSLAPHLTEMLFSIGVGEKIVATVRHADYPAAARAIPVLGDAFSVSVESVVALSPDLILAWATGGNQRSLQQLDLLGYPIYFNEAETLADIGDTAEKIAILTGHPRQGALLKSIWLDNLVRLKSRGNLLEGPASELRAPESKPPSQKAAQPRVFFQISDSQLFTVSAEHLIGQALSLCGARNIFADSIVMVPLVSFESVVALAPDLIIVSRPHESFESTWTEHWQRLGWSNRIRYIDGSLVARPSLRMIDGIDALCRIIRNAP